MRWKTVALSLLVLVLVLSLPVAAAPPPTVPRGPEYRINTTRATSHFTPSIAAFPNGGFVVVWVASGPLRARFLDAQGRPGREIRLAAAGADPKVVADRDGSFLVTWATSTPSSPAMSIFVRRFNRDGTPRGPRIRVSNLSASGRGRPVIAVGPDGRFAIAWTAAVRVPGTDSFYSNAVGRIFAADGTPLTSEILLLAGDPATAAGDDVVKAFSGGVALKADGTLITLVQSTEGGSCLLSFLVQRSPAGDWSSLPGLGAALCGPSSRNKATSLALRPDGGLIAAWTDYGVRAQRFAPNGTSLGESFQISQNTDYRQYAPAIGLQTGGRFVIAWIEEDHDGEGKGIFGRSFAPNGAPRTGDYQINVTTSGDQDDPAIAASRRGSVVVVVWAQQLEDDNGRSDIFARVIAPQP